MTKKAFAISAHPDDIEFMMAGTLLLLKKAGYEIHYMTVANGSLGSSVYSGMELPIVRGGEAKASAEIMGAIYHPPICADMEIFVNVETQSRMVPIIREVAPDIILTHGPYDYMEDHVNAGRLACTAAFARGMPNFRCTPMKVAENDVAIYHSLPLSLKDQLNKRIVPDFFVNVESEVETKKKALACHKSQKDWLDQTQGFNSYIDDMVDRLVKTGELCGKCKYAEGWFRHNPCGFCAEDYDPLRRDLKDFVIERA